MKVSSLSLSIPSYSLSSAVNPLTLSPTLPLLPPNCPSYSLFSLQYLKVHVLNYCHWQPFTFFRSFLPSFPLVCSHPLISSYYLLIFISSPLYLFILSDHWSYQGTHHHCGWRERSSSSHWRRYEGKAVHHFIPSHSFTFLLSLLSAFSPTSLYLSLSVCLSLHLPFSLFLLLCFA